MIDLSLLRMRYEILNVPIATLAEDSGINEGILKTEATNNNWSQWWPSLDDLQSAFSQPTTVPPHDAPIDDEAESVIDGERFDELSPLEEGSNEYIKEAKIRLQVFSLAKDLHLAYKYAAFESALVDKAHSMVEMCAEPGDIRQLTMSLKDLPGKMAAASLAISQGDDGMPMVIIRDLSGR